MQQATISTSIPAPVPAPINTTDYFSRIPVEKINVGENRIVVRRVGQGPNLLLIHGWPLSGITFRHILPELEKHFTCIIPDLPGLGDTEWANVGELTFSSQTKNLHTLIDQLALDHYAILAHDTGATIARLLAANDAARVTGLILLNTEIPNHRPPFLELYQKVSRIPGGPWLVKQTLKSTRNLRAPHAFGGCFVDRRLIDDEFIQHYITPLIEDAKRLTGCIGYLHGIQWELVDNIEQYHKKILAPVKAIWGSSDKTFPINDARAMFSSFSNFHGIAEIDNSALLPHEENPTQVSKAALEFLLSI